MKDFTPFLNYIIQIIEYNTRIIKTQKPSPETARLLEVYTTTDYISQLYGF